jgi:3-oxoacyl-[acyl-carrier protein] reductase
MTRGVLVTGGTRGIGLSIADAFRDLGDNVVGLTTSDGDLSDPAAAERLVASAIDTLGSVDVLVNNAAVIIPHPVAGTSYQDWQAAWQKTFAVNVFGAANMSYWVARHMIARGSGRIVNVGSRGAFRGEPDYPAYGASKAALHSLGQSLAVSLAPHGIGVASVAPGFIETERVADRLTGAEGDEIRGQSPFGRVGKPEEVAAAVVYLASPAAIWASGTVLDINGASYLRT